jgi:hypothetical protein
MTADWQQDCGMVLLKSKIASDRQRTVSEAG